MHNKAMVALLVIALALAGCNFGGPASRLTPSPTVTLTPAEVTQQPTSTVPPTITLAPSATAAGRATPTPSPTLTATRPPTTPIPGVTATFTPTPTLVPGTLIVSFTATPTEINPGDSITLAWSTRGDTATLWTILPTGQLGSFWDVPVEGSRVMTTDKTVRNSVSFMLAATSGGQSETATITVKVRCLDTWFFANPPGSCPQTSALVTAAVAQRFERGLMIWLQGNGMIYVLFSDSGSPAYGITQDQWHEGMPESDPNIVPPAGFYQPVRGFGIVWRGESSLGNVRDRLGWATAPEFSLSSAYQCDSAPKYTTCYLLGPDGVIVLKPERSGWTIWSGPTPGP